MNTDSFATRISRERQRLGSTLHQIGALLGVSHATIANWESGKAEPSAFTQPIYLSTLAKLKAGKAPRRQRAKLIHPKK